jgi:hypothetical protein
VGLGREAKQEAKKATNPEREPLIKLPHAKPTIINAARSLVRVKRCIPPGVGKYSKELDVALPGKHTRKLYDEMNREESNILSQLRTGMSKLKRYLNRIGVEESGLCDCGVARETTKHFLFRCIKWQKERQDILWKESETRRGCLSFFLGGKSGSDTQNWQPNMKAIRATINFSIATGRFFTLPETVEATPP